MTDVSSSYVDNRLLFLNMLKENNNQLSKIQSHKIQTAVANVRAKTKHVSTVLLVSFHRNNKKFNPIRNILCDQLYV